MMRATSGLRWAGLLVWLLAEVGCRKANGAVEPPKPHAPAGQVWLDREQAAALHLQTVPLEEHAISDTVITSGRISFDDVNVAHVYSPVAGKVSRLMASLGQRVKKGDPLAVIESPDVGATSSDVEKAEAEFAAATRDVERERSLWAKEATSQRDLERAEQAYRSARAELDRARQKAQLMRGTQGDAVSQSFVLRAPVAGEVLARAVAPGAETSGLYGGGTPVELFTIGEIDRVWLLADVYELDLGRIVSGTEVHFETPAWPGRTWTTKVDWISTGLDPVTRTAHVRCTLENPDHALRPEMFAAVKIRVVETPGLALPRDAVLRLGQQTVVFVAQGGGDGIERYQSMPVVVDEGEGDKWVRVNSGPPRGAQVVVAGALALSSLL